MSKFRTPQDRHQVMLLPPTLDKYVPADDAVRFVDTMVEEFDLEKNRSSYSDAGRLRDHQTCWHYGRIASEKLTEK